jgi:hypothetical protein
MSTKVIKCTCESEYQDRVYGTNNRLGNKTDKSSNKDRQTYRCTVCKKEH